MAGKNDQETGGFWEQVARTDPYWGVLTKEDYRSATLTEDARRRFFLLGEQAVVRALGVLAQRFGCPERFDTALEFGCGVGRLLMPLARRSGRAMGVDAAPTMLRLCAENAREAGLDNIELATDLGEFGLEPGSLDLVISFLVLQHIPSEAGYGHFAALLKLVRPGGWGAIQLTYANEIGFIRNESRDTGVPYRYYQRLGDQILRLVKGAAEPEPMLMNHYNLNEIMCILLDNNIIQHFAMHTNQAGILGIEFYFQKAPASAGRKAPSGSTVQ